MDVELDQLFMQPPETAQWPVWGFPNDTFYLSEGQTRACFNPAAARSKLNAVIKQPCANGTVCVPLPFKACQSLLCDQPSTAGRHHAGRHNTDASTSTRNLATDQPGVLYGAQSDRMHFSEKCSTWHAELDSTVSSMEKDKCAHEQLQSHHQFPCKLQVGAINGAASGSTSGGPLITHIPVPRMQYAGVCNQHVVNTHTPGLPGLNRVAPALRSGVAESMPHGDHRTALRGGHSSLYKKYKQAATARMVGSIASCFRDGLQDSKVEQCNRIYGSASSAASRFVYAPSLQKPAVYLGVASERVNPHSFRPRSSAQVAEPDVVSQNMLFNDNVILHEFRDSRHMKSSRLGRVPPGKTTLYKNVRLDHIRSMQLLPASAQAELSNRSVAAAPLCDNLYVHQQLGDTANSFTGDSGEVMLAVSGRFVPQKLLPAGCSYASQPQNTSFVNRAQTRVHIHMHHVPRTPVQYPDYSSPAALGCANVIMSRVRLPGGIKFVQLLDDSFMYKLGRTCGFTAMSMALGASYFQRLVHTLPVLASAVHDSYAFQPCQVGSHIEQGSVAGLELQHDVNLCSINFVCMYLAQKVCDEPPSLELLRSVLSSLFGAAVGYQQAYAVEAMCLDKLEWRLGPYFVDDNTCAWVDDAQCIGWLPDWLVGQAHSIATCTEHNVS